MNKKLPICVAVAAALAAGPVLADEREDLETLRQTTLNLIQALVQTGILTQEKADALIAEAKRAAVQATAPGGERRVVRVPYVPQTVRSEIKEELRSEVLAQAKAEGWAAPNAVPSWAEGMKWESDIRVRYQYDRFDRNNFSPLQLSSLDDPITVGNSQNDNSRLRARLRFGMEKQMGDMTTVGFRVATGSLTDPLSTNQTMGNSFDRYALGVDKAYMTLQPATWLALTGGRMANPFLGTDLVWHADLNFDGIAIAIKPQLADNVDAFFTTGVFPVMKLDPSPTSSAQSKWLYAYQAGVQWQPARTTVKAALALYDYHHVEGIANPDDSGAQNPGPYDSTAPQFKQKGNSLFQINVAQVGANGTGSLFGLASKFREADFTASVDVANLDPIHVIATADYVKNIGFDRAEILNRTGRDLEPRTRGYMAKLLVGTPAISRRGEWQVFGAYKYLQRDAVLDAFTDSDFRLGGTDAKGYIIGGAYGIDKNTWLSLRYLSADPIDGPPYSVDTLQFDLNARF
ncbi:MAG TPA: putative porin [Rhodocyclaceae bacterium]|nr:putative porin [Rhodocyclaceae bacterium]